MKGKTMARAKDLKVGGKQRAAGPAFASLPERLQKCVERLRQASKGLGITSATIVALRVEGEVSGYQLRLGTRIVKGLTAHFSVSSFGGDRQARGAARKVAEALALKISRGRGGSVPGRPTWRSSSPEPGIRFFWVTRSKSAPVLFVGTSWKERDGRPRTTCYSTSTNGVHGAVELAIAKRSDSGYVVANRAALIRCARKTYRNGPPAPKVAEA